MRASHSKDGHNKNIESHKISCDIKLCSGRKFSSKLYSIFTFHRVCIERARERESLFVDKNRKSITRLAVEILEVK